MLGMAATTAESGDLSCASRKKPRVRLGAWARGAPTGAGQNL